jgi:hypothetical protein
LHDNNELAERALETNHSQFKKHITERQHTLSTGLQRNRS